MIPLQEERDALELAQGKFNEVILALDPSLRTEPGVSGDWSPKDVVAHLIGWDRALTEYIVKPEGFNPEPLYEIDTFNGQSVRERAHQSWEETIEAWQRTFTSLQQAISLMTSEMKHYDRVRDWLGGRRDDYEYHTHQLVAWLEQG